MSSGTKKLVVNFSVLNEAQRKQIADKAGAFGYRTVFCDERDEALLQAKDAEVILGMDAALATAGDSLKWISTPSAGVDHFLDILSGTDILLSNASGAYGLTIAEHIVMVTLEMMRRKPEYDQLVREKKWERGLAIHSIHGARITLVGTGDIGSQAAIRLKAFGPASITGVNRLGKNPENLFDKVCTISDIEKVLPETDLLVLSLPSTRETRGLLTKERLQLLPEDAYLVNVGRGDVLDEKALEAMLREERLGGAALDVFEKEPLDDDSTLWNCPRLVLTTHIAGNWTLPYTVEQIVDLFLDDFEAYCEEKPMHNLVDLKAGY